MQVQAKAKQLRITPRKIGLVASLVRGRSVADSLVILEHTPKRAAKLLSTAIKSAQANAENNHKLAADDLVVSRIEVGSGGMFKRYRTAARGGMHPVHYRFANVTVILSAPDKSDAKRRKLEEKK